MILKNINKLFKHFTNVRTIETILSSFCFLFLFCNIYCTKTPVIAFCEGVDKTGKGIQCGKKFSTGDLTASITSKRFETDSLKVIIFKKTNYQNEKIEELTHTVSYDDTHATIPLSFYIEGEYLVEVRGKDNKLLGSEWIQIIDIY